MSQAAEQVRKLEAIRIRYENGDGLYGRDEIYTLLHEIHTLSERIIMMTTRPEDAAQDIPLKDPPPHDWLEMKSIREGWDGPTAD